MLKNFITYSAANQFQGLLSITYNIGLLYFVGDELYGEVIYYRALAGVIIALCTFQSIDVILRKKVGSNVRLAVFLDIFSAVFFLFIQAVIYWITANQLFLFSSLTQIYLILFNAMHGISLVVNKGKFYVRQITLFNVSKLVFLVFLARTSLEGLFALEFLVACVISFAFIWNVLRDQTVRLRSLKHLVVSSFDTFLFNSLKGLNRNIFILLGGIEANFVLVTYIDIVGRFLNFAQGVVLSMQLFFYRIIAYSIEELVSKKKGLLLLFFTIYSILLAAGFYWLGPIFFEIDHLKLFLFALFLTITKHSLLLLSVWVRPYAMTHFSSYLVYSNLLLLVGRFLFWGLIEVFGLRFEYMYLFEVFINAVYVCFWYYKLLSANESVRSYHLN